MKSGSFAGAAMPATGALAVAIAFASPAAADPSRSVLAQGLFGDPAPDEPAGRYATPDGVRFVLERRGPAALLKFDGEDEVLALRPVPGPRGDEIYKTDTGETLLRVTALGGVIIFHDEAGLGAPAALEGPAGALTPLATTPQSLRSRLSLIARRAASQIGGALTFVLRAPEDGEEGGVALDAAARAAQAVAESRSTQVRRVVIEVGPAPAAVLTQDGALRVTVNPELGYAGRPSAAALRRVVDGPTPER